MRRFAVIGLGRFGQKLAIALAMSGSEVIAIDRNRNEIDLIRDQVSHAVRLDSTDEEAMKAQGVDKADVAIIALGQESFEAAILTVVNLRQMGVKQIYARAESLIAGEVFSKVGATEVIYPEIESAQRWAYKLIAPQIGEKIDFSPGYSLARIKAPPSFDGKTVMDLQLRQKYRVNLVIVKRGDEAKARKNEKDSIINIPMPDTIIYAEDILMVAGSDADLARLPQE
ncbi:MAG: TrkA family potassium uptake protein [Sedimentisphaerales bacterium]|jgi:trk system potassium uptake protein TrkA|nr:TrkA family potassium uptake protein [Sedimentisphaerales bacterium]NLZ04286.1 TrkA family potassium uptake protein [Phycisphaerae bacterium]HNY77848.1 TrkA family potassium uptake protein [Sedimentisphaerales bacterium]HOC63103.1 TrkA family potassium uptake protein [Sedimentisphaerales bacterium]HOH64023.1 TrkA family potassium uptake protein [Sedimentisphaerales bacterium]